MGERIIKIRTLNPHITCKICHGYLIDATTVTECLHTFCKSCVVKHLEEENTCPDPDCQLVIHQSHPLNYINFDRTMQDMVYKLVPGLEENEINREREFYRKRNLPYPKEVPLDNAKVKEEDSKEKGAESDYHRFDEQVNISLECIASDHLKSLKRKYIRVSSQATVTQIKKFIAKYVCDGIDKYRDVDVLCNNELLGKDHTLKFVYVTRWRFQNPPLRLQYRPSIEL
ncbi:hypothetical protein V9T40_001607 [Parthenolecanium corni]|uniref:RING-type domain-containing protein n=1 Tax=Parthenolecanium corni TaxID=536013 RepID=A0AAN9TIA8_9HEMI